MSYVYLLKSLKDNNYYIGSTKDVKKRFYQHQKGLVKATCYRRPLKLLGYQKCQTILEASSLEKKYKKSHDALQRAIKKMKFKIINIGE
ncbi:hypothetical protein A2W24_03470 [Microgenomates group bacterium RBG_16_45_19]|nr:MAG: hypothetical protein A2W24_03470 [Microgenomates group bacterium RBG_16_45_19]